jgi:hypothetical protein
MQSDGSFESGVWSTDGIAMNLVLGNGSDLDFLRSDLTAVEGFPAGSRVVVRILTPLSSHKNKAGDKIAAALISPASIDDKILLPQGTIFNGVVTHAHGVGWALRHEPPRSLSNSPRRHYPATPLWKYIPT